MALGFGWVNFLACLVFLVFAERACGTGTDSGYAKYKDPKKSVSARVEDLVKRMTLDEKIGQMTQIERTVATPDVLKHYYIGSVLSGGGSVPSPKASTSEWVNMVSGMQKGSMSTRLQIPMIYGIDAVHGHNNVYGATIFPHNVGLGATRDPELLKRIGAATAAEVRATGIPYTFAPCIAVCRDPRWGRCYESYSEDPSIVKSMTDIIYGLQGQPPANTSRGLPYIGGPMNVAACAKHFVGDGGTTKGIDENNTVIDYKGLTRIHMTPYFDAIYKSVSTIMISYSSWNGQKMHDNRFLVSDILKKALRFKGFTISDWQGVDRITSPPGVNYAHSVVESINAGIDMIMVPYNFTDFINDLKNGVKQGAVPMSRIDDAVRRILRVKFTLGLFEQPMPDPTLTKQLGSQEHRNVAREAVRKSLVLLKNGKAGDKPLLPLDKNAPKILVAGTHADNLGYQCGGWTIEWQGLSGNITIGTTILSGIKSTVGKSSQVVYQQSPDASYVKSQGFSYAIVVVGEPPYAEMFGDNDSLTIPLGGDKIISNVCASVKCLVVMVSGRPLVVEQYLPSMDAFVAAWLPGTEGKGVAEVIFGDYPFQGKLSRTWFKRVDQLPMNIGDKHYDPLFPLGFGLTTTKPGNLRSSFGIMTKEIPSLLSMIIVIGLTIMI